MGIFSNLKNMFSKNKDANSYLSGLKKTRSSFLEGLKKLGFGFKGIDEEFLEELLITLLESDIGIKTATKIINRLEEIAKERKVREYSEVVEILVEVMKEVYGDNTVINDQNDFTIILMIGVNGAGKTTTTAKLAYKYKNDGEKVLLAAADTFRAGAVEQLEVWANRIGVGCIKGNDNEDPSSVIVKAIRQAKEEGYTTLIIDSAGRLQNKVNLMNELAKMNKVIVKEAGKEADEVLLVLDATTGQNGISQAEIFNEACNLTGIVLTKLDGSSKGGIVIAIRDLLNVPVKLVGLGEKQEDLKLFDIDSYLYSIVEGISNE